MKTHIYMLHSTAVSQMSGDSKPKPFFFFSVKLCTPADSKGGSETFFISVFAENSSCCQSVQCDKWSYGGTKVSKMFTETSLTTLAPSFTITLPHCHKRQGTAVYLARKVDLRSLDHFWYFYTAMKTCYRGIHCNSSSCSSALLKKATNLKEPLDILWNAFLFTFTSVH